jgi:hypothetical protein
MHDLAQELLSLMRNAGIAPSTVTRLLLLKKYAASGNGEAAIAALQEMSQMGPFHPRAVVLALRACKRDSQHVEACIGVLVSNGAPIVARAVTKLVEVR